MTIAALLSILSADAQTLAKGGQFMDLLLPMEGSVAATASDWGTTAGENTQYAGSWEGTLGRWKDNGIEDTERSYWGGNIVKGSDGKYHIYVAGWPSDTKGHMNWSNSSMVYHVVSDNVWGPYTYVSTLGTGHNPEIYKTGDTYVIYKIEPLGYYKSTTLGDSWETGEYTFDLRGRALIAGENRETSLSNCSFAKREDGSFVMIDRGGGIWVSRDGLTEPWHQLTDASVYLNSEIKNRGTLEDPVIWRDHLQYHMVVNDWMARYAYYYRSLDGLHWVKEAGKAYTGQDPFAKHSDGTVEAWHKYERPRVYQDELGRAIRMNFAVIDCVKQSDVAGDNHSSKNINMPLTRQILLEVQGTTPITASTTSISVLIKAEEGFNPRTDLNLATLKFGAHDKVNYGNGFSYSSSENSGESDLIVTFTGNAGESGITTGEWAAKMLGEKTDGSVAFGYAKMPGIDYKPAMLSAVTPAIAADGTVQSVSITNYGQKAADATTVRIYNQTGTTMLAHGTTSELAAYGNETVSLTKDNAAAAGYKSIQVRFYIGETLLNTENIPLAAINAVQSELQTVIDEANALLADPRMTNGTAELQEAIDEAVPVAKCYNVEAIEAQKTALGEALNSFKYANASPTNGLSITIPNAECNDLSAWTLTRMEADNAPGWKLNTTNRYGFDGNFIETYKGGGLKVANKACQTLSGLPAGRYRLRAKAIATNNGSAATGVTFYAKGSTLVDSPVSQTVSTGSTECTEYMLELTLAEEGSLEFGIDIASTNNATWVCFDSWSLKYFGTQTGDIVEIDRNTPVLGVDPQKVYHIKHLNTARNRYLAATPDASGHLLTTNSAAEKGEYALLPVLGRQGYYYIYNTKGYFVTPSTTNWTLSKTTPAEVLVTLNNTNQSALGTTDNIYLLGESSQHANPQIKDGVQLVYTYSAHDTDKGNNWVLEPVSGGTSSLDLANVTTAIESLVASSAAEETGLTFTATVGEAGFGTVVVPFDADVTGDVEAWQLTAVDGSDRILGSKLTTIEANQPVLLRNAGTLTLTAKEGTAAYEENPESGLLHGTYAAGTVSAGSYVLQNLSGTGVAFYRVENGNEPSVKPFRAWLETAAAAPVLTFMLDDTATGVSGIEFVSSVHEIYSVGGVRHTTLGSGLNIVRMSDGRIKKVRR